MEFTEKHQEEMETFAVRFDVYPLLSGCEVACGGSLRGIAFHGDIITYAFRGSLGLV